ncbi:monocarboxylate transporter 12-like [Ruditapes philippinarum]|uniref:monocarboxylate transporter 12-like n=1 Tax=Ruditapes philippinarum TaxID=129788 RepID=UPI00295BD645|nr:monocarboxylate transporter 12-like [Ruditapes philippinarum]
MVTADKDSESGHIESDKGRFGDNEADSFNDLDRGWAWAVLFASFGTFCILGGLMYAIGISHSTLLERYNQSVAMTSWAGALHTALFSLGGPLSSTVIDRYSCRTTLVLSGIFFLLGYIGTAFAQSMELAIFTFGILSGIGGALGYTATMVVVSFNFRKRRNLALGIAVSGVGAGVFIFPPLMQLSRDSYGPFGLFIILASMAANVISFGVMCFPSKLEKYTQRQRRLRTLHQSRERQTCWATSKIYFGVLFNKPIICLCMAMFFFCLGTILMYLHLPSFIVSKGFTALEAAFLVSLSGILSIFGRLLTGIAANLKRIKDIHLFSGSIGIVAIACFIYSVISNYFWGHVIFVVLFGLFFGNCYVVITGVTLPFVGINYISAAIGLQFFFAEIGSIIGPVFAGFLVDVGGHYEPSILIAAACILLSAIVSSLTLCSQKDEMLIDRTINIVDNQEKELQILRDTNQ